MAGCASVGGRERRARRMCGSVEGAGRFLERVLQRAKFGENICIWWNNE